MDRADTLTDEVIFRLVKIMKLNNQMKSPCRSTDSRRWSFASSGYSTTTAGSNAVSWDHYLIIIKQNMAKVISVPLHVEDLFAAQCILLLMSDR